MPKQINFGRDDWKSFEDVVKNLPEGAPVFVLLPTDENAPLVIDYYAQLSHQRGADFDTTTSALDHADTVRHWQADNRERVHRPDVVKRNEPAQQSQPGTPAGSTHGAPTKADRPLPGQAASQAQTGPTSATQAIIQKGYLNCPSCSARREVRSHGDVVKCAKCGADTFNLITVDNIEKGKKK